MSTLSYGGLTMKLVKIVAWNREAVSHGPRYLWTKHTIAATCTFNPQATSFRRRFVPQAEQGAPPVPQASAVFPGWQMPRESQHPCGQLCASQK